MDPTPEQLAQWSRMQWAARRGMLELDLVLEPFVREQYLSLDDDGKQRFEDLMLCEDQDLFAWFLRRETPEPQHLRAMVKQILDYAHRPR